MLEVTKTGIENRPGNHYIFLYVKPVACILGILGCYDSPIRGIRMGSEKGNRDDQGLDQRCEEHVLA